MLARLTVDNFALLKHVDLSFDGRFNVLSGETGAGKSIIIDAVKLVLGERANVADIRVGEDHALVEAVFVMAEGHAVFQTLDDLGLEHDDQTVVLTRQIRENGKNVCRVNRQIVTLNQFKTICAQLISIYGQHDYDELGDPAIRLSLLDTMGDMAHQELRAQVVAAYAQAQQSGRALKRALRQQAKLEKELAALDERVEELAPLELKKGEEEELAQRYKQAAHSQDLYDAAFAAAGALYDAQGSVHEVLTDALERLKAVSQYDEQVKSYVRELESVRIVIDDTARDLEHYREGIDFDPASLEAMDERLAQLAKLRRKYQMDIDSLVDALAEWKEKINHFAGMDADIADLRKAYSRDRAAYTELAESLHDSRERLGKEFSSRLISELADMAMEAVRFEVRFERFAGDASGTDTCLFMIAPNPGMPLRPLYDIASGGEMSRIMLAIKSILSGAGNVETLIFDEIDTGIGGLVLTTVADKLEQLGEHEQVICVTHAPIIAARADRNFYIEKSAVDGLTETHLTVLDTEDAVISEIARMSGSQDEWQREHAARLRAARKRQ